MTLLYVDPRFEDHLTGPRHPERPERLLYVRRQLQRNGLDQRCTAPAWKEITSERLAQVHGAEYLAQVEQFCRAGGGRLEEDTVCSERSIDIARLAAGAVCDAVDRVLTGEDTQALCLVRPPGHHALADAAMGFCLLNNVALGARAAVRQAGLDRVLIVDWDVHHGNGTQDIFWDDEQVGFLSIHRWPFYPGTGDQDETGTGAALGTKCNLPVAFGTSRSEYLERFSHALEKLAAKVKPQLILISAGFDAHRDDPIGSLGLETEDFETLTQRVLDVAQVHSAGRIVSVLEGGYNTGALAGSVELHLRTLLGA